MSEILVKMCSSADPHDPVLDLRDWLSEVLGKPRSIVFATNNGYLDTDKAREKWRRVHDKFLDFVGDQATYYMYDPFKIVWYKGPSWELFNVYSYYGSLEILTVVSTRIDDDALAIQAKLTHFT